MKFRSSIKHLLPSSVRLRVIWLAQQLQEQPLYRGWLQRQFVRYSIPTFEIEHHDLQNTAMFASRLLPQLENVYQIHCQIRNFQICGGWLYILREPMMPRAWISDVWVHPLARGGRLGKSVIDEMFALLKKHQIERVGLSVDRDNSVAIRLYESFGFAFVPVVPPACFALRGPSCLQMECSIEFHNTTVS